MVIKRFSGRYHFQLNWKITLFYVLLLPVLLSLGFWQLDRADYKTQLQRLYDQRNQEAPVAIAKLDLAEDLAYIRVALNGYFDNAHHFLLDNRTFNGRPGYEVITPFIVADSDGETGLVWVNRGWIPQGVSRDELPEIQPVTADLLQIAGQVVMPSEAFVLANLPFSGQWPEVIQVAEVPMLTQKLAAENIDFVFPYFVRLSEGEVGSFQRIWQPLSTQPEKSLGYAVQWFLMATALTLLYLYSSIKRQ